MPRLLAAVAAAALVSSCYASSRPLDDGGVVDEGGTIVPPESELEPCEIVGGLPPGDAEYVLQIYHPTCLSGICVHYNEQTFCTDRCNSDPQCRDVGPTYCNLTVSVGDPEMLGNFCVP